MKIKFKDSDPRAGTVIQTDSSLGKQFIDKGYAVEVKEGAEAEKPVEPKQKKPANGSKA